MTIQAHRTQAPALPMADERLAGIEERARLWRVIEDDPREGGAVPLGLEDVEDLLAEVRRARRQEVHHIGLISRALGVTASRSPMFGINWDEIRAELAQLSGELAQEDPQTWPTP